MKNLFVPACIILPEINIFLTVFSFFLLLPTPHASILNPVKKLAIDICFLRTQQLNLSDEELKTRITALKAELLAVWNGAVKSERHEKFMEGGQARSEFIETALT